MEVDRLSLGLSPAHCAPSSVRSKPEGSTSSPIIPAGRLLAYPNPGPCTDKKKTFFAGKIECEQPRSQHPAEAQLARADRSPERPPELLGSSLADCSSLIETGGGGPNRTF